MDKIKQYIEERERKFERDFCSLNNWVEKRGWIGTKQGIKDHNAQTITGLIDEFIEYLENRIKEEKNGGATNTNFHRKRVCEEIIEDLTIIS